MNNYLINPNDIDNTDIYNLINKIEDIKPFVELLIYKRSKSIINIGSDNTIDVSNSKPETINLQGFINSDDKYYSTRYTEYIVGPDTTNDTYEGFGIQDININIDANKIPIVNITFIDVKGNSIQDSNSKFNSLFDLPPPIFKLRIKGAYGPLVEFRLMIQGNTTVEVDSNSGNHIIKAKFVGDKFSSMTDILFNYLKAVHFYKGLKSTSDGEVVSVYDLLYRLKSLYNNIKRIEESDEEKRKRNEIESKTSIYNNLTDLLNSYISKESIKSDLTQILNPNENIINDITNNVVNSNKGRQLIFNLVNLKYPTNKDEYKPYFDAIQQSFRNSLEQNDAPRDLIQIIYNTSYNKITLEYRDLFSYIENLRNEVLNKSKTFNQELETKITNVTRKFLGDNEKQTAYNVFKVLMNDYDYLINEIKTSGDLGSNQNRNVPNIIGKLGFPTVVNNNNLVYPGSIPAFKTWPEVQFIEKFVQSMVNEQINEKLYEDTLNNPNINNPNNYIPLNPYEYYKNYNIFNEPELINPYLSNTNNVNELLKLIILRYIVFINKGTNHIEFDNDFLLQKSKDEAINILTSIKDNKQTKNFFSNLYRDIRSESNVGNYLLNNPSTTEVYSQTTKFGTSNINIGNTTFTNYSSDVNSLLLFSDDEINIDLVDNTTTNDNSLLNTFIKNKSQVYTKENILFVKDNLTVDTVSDFIVESSDITQIYNEKDINIDNNIKFKDLILLFGKYNSFRFSKNSILEVPLGLILNLGYRFLSEQLDNNVYFTIKSNIFLSSSLIFYKSSNFFKNCIKVYSDFLSSYNINNDTLIAFNKNRSKKETDIINDIFGVFNTETNRFEGKYYIVVNDTSVFGDSEPNINYVDDTNKFVPNNLLGNTLFNKYFFSLLTELNSQITSDNKRIAELSKEFQSNVLDNDLKLELYNSFQMIYENYYARVNGNNTKTIDTFNFVDRNFNDISKKCILDLSSMIDDSTDSKMSVLSVISNILTKNNFWFYPFQNLGLFNDPKKWSDGFRLSNEIKVQNTQPQFLCIYVGGLSKSLKTNDLIPDDGVTIDNIPSDLLNTNVRGFIINYTGIQNQAFFNDFRFSTEDYKNTDESLRITSSIINNQSNSFSLPKGQSLLTLYKKRSYSISSTIPHGCMTIQPTQYCVLTNNPLFNGFYMLYSTTHSIDSSNQLKTSFKAYRISRNTLPIVDQPYMLYNKNNKYTNTINKINEDILSTFNSTIFVRKPNIKTDRDKDLNTGGNRRENVINKYLKDAFDVQKQTGFPAINTLATMILESGDEKLLTDDKYNIYFNIVKASKVKENSDIYKSNKDSLSTNDINYTGVNNILGFYNHKGELVKTVNNRITTDSKYFENGNIITEPVIFDLKQKEIGQTQKMKGTTNNYIVVYIAKFRAYKTRYEGVKALSDLLLNPKSNIYRNINILVNNNLQNKGEPQYSDPDLYYKIAEMMKLDGYAAAPNYDEILSGVIMQVEKFMKKYGYIRNGVYDYQRINSL